MKTSEGGEACGYDAGKKVTGRKRHILVDTLGLIIAVVSHAASTQDRDGGRTVLQRAQMDERERLQVIWADSGYAGQFVEWVEGEFGVQVDIVSKREGQRGFEVQPHRWIVERTLAWISKHRRLARDYERLTVHSESFVYLAMIGLMLDRLIS